MTVGAVVVAYHTSETDLRKCLHSLRDCQHVVVVDNSPSDNLKEVANTFGAHYLPQPVNQGFAAAANRGADELHDDCVFYLNPDAVLAPGTISVATRYFLRDPKCGILGFLLASPAGGIERASFGATVTPLSLLTRHIIKRKVPQRPSSVGWTSGGALIVRHRVLRDLGGFDPNFFLFWEDVDLCRRARAAGWRTVLLPHPIVVHRRGASLSDRRRRAQLYDQSADKYFCKHYAKAICLPLRYLRRIFRWLSRQAR
jgi:GT2 family glycosyltransferase